MQRGLTQIFAFASKVRKALLAYRRPYWKASLDGSTGGTGGTVPRRAMDRALRQRFLDKYAAEIGELGELLRCDLSCWLTESRATC